MNVKKIISNIFVLILSVSLFSQNLENNPLLFGKPSRAQADVSFNDDYLMEKEGYSLSYNNSTLCANWVCWHLDSADLGEAERGNKFREDITLPEGWYKVTSQDYQFSLYGFDRGHLCPSADRTLTQELNNQTFLMTNMIPQSPDCNRIVWMHLENYERELVKQGNEVYIFAGPAGKGGIGNRGIFEEILTVTKNEKRSKIVVPENCWKILLVLPQGTDDFERVVSGMAETIAVIIPNRQGCQYDANGNKIDWDYYKSSVDEIEKLTGFDFFNLLPADIETELEK